MEFKIRSIGKIVKSATGNHLEIDEEYLGGLLELKHYDYIHVYWWARDFDKPEHRSLMQVPIPYAKGDVIAGVFACRSPERPNLIMDTVCKVRGVNEKKGKIFIENIDAFPDTPIIDIKPYLNCVDRVKKSKVPKWFPSEWGEWMHEKGIC